MTETNLAEALQVDKTLLEADVAPDGLVHAQGHACMHSKTKTSTHKHAHA